MGAFIFRHAMIAWQSSAFASGLYGIVCILDGQYEFRIDDAVPAGPGALVVIPACDRVGGTRGQPLAREAFT